VRLVGPPPVATTVVQAAIEAAQTPAQAIAFLRRLGRLRLRVIAAASSGSSSRI
jgi:hypothetical protein